MDKIAIQEDYKTLESKKLPFTTMEIFWKKKRKEKQNNLAQGN